MTTTIRALGLILALVLSQKTVAAAVVFDTIGQEPFLADPGSVYTFAWNYNRQPLGLDGIADALQFSVGSQSYLLDSVSVMIANSLQARPNLGIAVVQDDNGVPGEQVVDWVAINPVTPIVERQLVTFDSSLHPQLLAGETYWLRFQPLALNTTDSSDNSFYTIAIPMARQDCVFAQRLYLLSTMDWEPWRLWHFDTPMAVRIEGTAVPEPEVALLLALGGLGWLLLWQRRRAAISRR
jgi:hypothetical protein